METNATPDPVARRRQALDRFSVRASIQVARFVARRWLALVGLLLGALITTAILAPLLRSLGFEGSAHALYALLSLTCHQLPERSYFLFGYQMGFCQRDLAIYTTTLLAGLAFAPLRDRLRPLSWTTFFLFATPMAVDGFTQLFAWRESTWELRTVTGALFALGWVWLIYPWAEFHLRRMDLQLQRELQALG